LIFDLSHIPVITYKEGEIPIKTGVYIKEGSEFLEVWKDASLDKVNVIPFAWVKKDIEGIPNTLSLTINELNDYWNPGDNFETFEITKISETFH